MRIRPGRRNRYRGSASSNSHRNSRNSSCSGYRPHHSIHLNHCNRSYSSGGRHCLRTHLSTSSGCRPRPYTCLSNPSLTLPSLHHHRFPPLYL
jgi:hypothetical protein